MSGAYRRIFWILAYTVITFSPARADYHYASHEGSNEYPYTSWETAANVIQDAVSAASPHDTVYIGAGEYNQTIRIPEDTDYLSIIGMGMDSTYLWRDVVGEYLLRGTNWGPDDIFIQGIHFTARGVCIVPGFASDYVRVVDCKFAGIDADRGAGIHTSIEGNSLDVENCIFENIGSGIQIPWAIPPYFSVRNCLFDHVGGYAIDCAADKVIVQNNICRYWADKFFNFNGRIDTLIYTNNLTYHNISSFAFGGVEVWDQIDNNTSYNDALIEIGFPAFRYTQVFDTLYSYNNSITSDVIGIDFFVDIPDAHIDLRYNNLKNDVEDIRFQGEYGTLDTSVIYHEFPMFNDPENGDFHLQAFSPLIDAGAPWILDVDGSRSDIGAYGGPGGESYEYQDLAPLVPDSITFEVADDSIVFNWRMNEEADFYSYLIFRDTIPGFEPSIFNLIAEPETSYFNDSGFTPGRTNYYRFASVDSQDNQSDYTDEIEVIPTAIDDFGGAELPKITAITNNYPNPFNSQTTIVYQVANLGPLPAQIDIEIYDLLGRKVATLVSARMDVGTHRVSWDGRNDREEEVPSGVYFARISQWGASIINKPKKLVLIR